MHEGDENIIQFMQSLYATLYFSSTVIPGVPRAPGMCHPRGCTPSWELSSQRLAELCLSGCWHHLAKAATAPGFAPVPTPSPHSKGPQMNSGTGQFPDKERKLLEGGTWPCYAGACSPACQQAAEAGSSCRDSRGTVQGRN